MFLYLFGLLVFLFLFRWSRERQRVGNESDKYVFITGCDSGFGNLLARHLDKLGYRVIASCFTEKGEDEVRKACSDRLTTIHLDVTKTDSVNKAALFIKTLVGDKGLWAVVNNAGVFFPVANHDWLSVEDFRMMLDVNLFGVIAVTLSVLPLIKKARGRVVNVSSVAGRVSSFVGPYTISKFGVEAFNDSLRIQMKPFGVKVLCIEPGAFKTNVFTLDAAEKNLKQLWDRLPQEVKDEYGSLYLNKGRTSFQPRKYAVTLGPFTTMYRLNLHPALFAGGAMTLAKRVLRGFDEDLMKVVSCMEHAISAVHPRTRYLVGWEAKFFWLPMSYMPTFITDYVFLKLSIQPEKSVV